MITLAKSISRLGTESAFEVLARAQALAAGGRDIINLGIGQPDFRTPEHIVEAGIKALRDGHHGYTPANGLPALRASVSADLHRRHGVEVNPDNVVVVPGGKPTLFFAMMLLGEPGVEIMYPNPGFPIYESVIKFSGATPVPIAASPPGQRLTSWWPDWRTIPTSPCSPMRSTPTCSTMAVNTSVCCSIRKFEIA